MIHTCPRCDLRFRSDVEVKHHLGADHGLETETLERGRYPASRDTIAPLYPDPAQVSEIRRYLVVANQTLGPRLAAELAAIAARQPSTFVVVVPATESGQGTATARAEARWRLEHAMGDLRAAGLQVEGVVGDPDPMNAVESALRDAGFDEIVVSTLPPGISHWLGVDLPARIGRRFRLPVTTITATT